MGEYVLSSFLPSQSIFACIGGGAIRFLFIRRPFQNRAGAILGVLSDALRDRSIPDQRFLINIGDRPCGKGLLVPWRVFGPAEADGYRDIAAPDFVFGGWHEAALADFDGGCASIGNAGQVPAETSLLGWYGNVNRIAARRRLVEIGEQHPNLVQAVDVGNWFGRGERLDRPEQNVPTPLLSMTEQVRRFRFLIDVEGVGYSGRLKLLLHSGRPVFIQERPWREWYFCKLRAWEHYVPVDRDLGNLIANLEKVLTDSQLGQRIGEAGRRFAREHLTRNAAIAVWRDLLMGTRNERLQCVPTS